jgi:hypothetical protein
MRFPPRRLLRDEPPPADLLLVVRGGVNSLSDTALDRSASDCWEQYGFFGVSVFAAPRDDLIALSRSNAAIRRRSEVRTARCGSLRAAGFEVAATFTNPGHYSAVLPDATPERFALLRSCFSPPVENPGFQPDR